MSERMSSIPEEYKEWKEFKVGNVFEINEANGFRSGERRSVAEKKCRYGGILLPQEDWLSTSGKRRIDVAIKGSIFLPHPVGYSILKILKEQHYSGHPAILGDIQTVDYDANHFEPAVAGHVSGIDEMGYIASEEGGSAATFKKGDWSKLDVLFAWLRFCNQNIIQKALTLMGKDREELEDFMSVVKLAEKIWTLASALEKLGKKKPIVLKRTLVEASSGYYEQDEYVPEKNEFLEKLLKSEQKDYKQSQVQWEEECHDLQTRINGLVYQLREECQPDFNQTRYPVLHRTVMQKNKAKGT